MAAAKKSAPAKHVMSEAHKQALAEGRTQGRAVRAYLEALESHKPKRGRKRTADSISRRLAAIDRDLDRADPMKKLALIQERLDLQRELDGFDNAVDLTALEADFIDTAWNYSQSKGITRAAWREAGVPASVLSAAGI